jgi:hypothetical protein
MKTSHVFSAILALGAVSVYAADTPQPTRASDIVAVAVEPAAATSSSVGAAIWKYTMFTSSRTMPTERAANTSKKTPVVATDGAFSRGSLIEKAASPLAARSRL